jgi:hypothetical protein
VVAQAKKPMFELQRVSPSGNHRRVLQIRFLMASQALAAIFRTVSLLPPTPATAESKNYLMMLSIGAANEAAIAFLEADRGGALDELLKSGWTEMQETVARLRQECNEHVPGSLRKQILLVARNTMGFHWDPKIVKRSLDRLREADVAVWAGGENEQIADTAFPLVSAIIHDSLRAAIGGTEEDVEAMMSRTVSMQADCYHLAHGLYAVALKNAGVQ